MEKKEAISFLDEVRILRRKWFEDFQPNKKPKGEEFKKMWNALESKINELIDSSSGFSEELRKHEIGYVLDSMIRVKDSVDKAVEDQNVMSSSDWASITTNFIALFLYNLEVYASDFAFTDNGAEEADEHESEFSESMSSSEDVIWRNHVPMDIPIHLIDHQGEYLSDLEEKLGIGVANEDVSSQGAFMEKIASKLPSIVVYADIRRSQELLTYSDDHEVYKRYMTEFFEKSKEMVFRHCGVFDKFTGDGFLAFFNKGCSSLCYNDWIESFINFCWEIFLFAKKHFSLWEEQLTKIPDSKIGLAIGADIGLVEFHINEGHLVALDKSIVWAARLSDVATANELAVNNKLFHALEKARPYQFAERPAKTKSGEAFLARVLSF